MKKTAFCMLICLASSPALAGFCQDVGQWKQCFDNDGRETTVQGLGGGAYRVEQYDKKGRSDGGQIYYDYSAPRNGGDEE